MNNLGQMMKRAQEVQAKMAELQETMQGLEITGSAGGGMVMVTLNGKGEMRALSIDPALCNGDEREVLEDLVVAAFNDAKGKVEARLQEEMAKITGGLALPGGFKLPF
jgi:hypothetical protein